MKDTAIVGGLVAAYMGRDKLVSGILRGSGRLLKRFGRQDAELAEFELSRSVDRMRWLTHKGGLDKLAIEQVAEQRIRRSLVEDLGWTSEQTSHLFSSKRVSSVWTAKGIPVSDELSGEHYSALRRSLGRSNTDIYSDIEQARLRSSVDTLYAKRFAGDPDRDLLVSQVDRARSEIEREYLRQLKDLSTPRNLRETASGQSAWSVWLARNAGAENIRLKDVAGLTLDKRTRMSIESSTSYLKDLASRHADIGLNIDAIPVTGLWRDASGNVTDLRGMKGMLGRWHAAAQNNFQVPMIPYFQGFSPTTLFPWLGGDSADLVNLLSYKNIGRQVGISDMIAGREMNVATVGRTAIGFSFGDSGVDASVMAKNIRTINAQGGFYKRVLQTMHAAKEADAPSSVLDWLGKQSDPSLWSRLASIKGKYFWNGKGEPYPAEALRLIFARDQLALQGPEAIQSVARFLKTSGSMDAVLFHKVFRPEAVSDPLLRKALTNIGEDSAIIDYFVSVPRGFTPLSDSLSSTLHAFENSEGAFRWSYHPHRSRKIVDTNLLGNKDYTRGIDQMRQSLIEEYILGYPLSDTKKSGSILERIAALPGISEDERQRAASLIQGTLLQNTIRNRGFETALSDLTRTPGLRENAEYMVNKYLSRIDTHVPIPDDLDLPNLFLVRGHESVLGQINKSIKEGGGAIDAVYDLFSSRATRQYTRASVYGMSEPENFTSSSIPIYFMQERMNRMLSEVGLGLADRDLGSAASIAWGFAAKRALPAWLGYQAYSYLNYEADKANLPSPKRLAANVRANLSLARAAVFGSEHWDQLYPGLSDSPLGAVFNGSNTYEEQKEQIRSGYSPVKSNRFWLFGSRSEFTGEKIRYYQPDQFQRAYSGWESAENAEISSDSYWEHSILPTPRYPLSPVAHFVDPYWFERKHSMGANPDRPYVVSGPLFTPETPWGPILNETLGTFLKPERVLHPEYDPRSQRMVREINAAYSGIPSGTLSGLLGLEESDPVDAAYASIAEDDESGFGLYQSSFAQIKPAGGIVILGGAEKGGWGSAKSQLAAINAELKARGSYSTPLRLADTSAANLGFSGSPDDVLYPNSASQMYRSLQNQAGIYGWLSEFITGGRPTGTVMEDPSAAYGLSPRFWELNLGGLGGELSEIGRRFLLKRPGTVDYYNPVPNSLWGSWLPGDNSYINLQRGDPYTQIPNGIMRLPGEAYEKLHGIRLMQTRASSVGKPVDELVAEMLHMSPALEEEKSTGQWAGLRKAVQANWKRKGLLRESGIEVFDDKLGVSGQIDALLQIQGQNKIGEIKTMSGKRFRARSPYSEHLDQLNFYMHTTGIHSGVLVYANRDNPEEVKAFDVSYNPVRQLLLERKLFHARRVVSDLVRTGKVSRAQLYDHVTRFEILADVAPYSSEFQAMKTALAGNDQVNEEQHKRIQSAKKRASALKKSVDITPYHFSQGADLEHSVGVVQRIIDPNTIQMVGGEIVRLAGVRSSEARIEEYFDEHGQGLFNDAFDWIAKAIDSATGGSWGGRHLGSGRTPAERMFARFGIVPGSPIGLRYSEDENEQRGQDMFNSLRAVVMAGPVNVNRELLNMGVALERENDWTAAGVEARFSTLEKIKGGIWERVTHLDTPLATKFMRNRSAYEEYVRAHVYGKSSGSWEHPIRDYVWPTLDAYVTRNPAVAGLSLGFFASMFTPARSAKLKVGTYAALVGAGLSFATHAKEIISGEPWIPGRVERQREIEEYYDVLNYLKYSSLYNYASDRAKSEENFDVEEFVEEQAEYGDERKRIQRGLSKRKPHLKLDGSPSAKEQLSLINKRLKSLQSYEKDVRLGPWATQAMLYRQKMESTAYAMGGSQITEYKNLMRAIPKYEREIVAGMLKDSTPEEKRKFFNLLPDYQKRLLGRLLGMPEDQIPERKPLESYFKTHTLPGPEWRGWNPGVDLNMLKARTVSYEGLDPMDFKLYPQTIAQAEAITQEVDVPTVNGHSTHIRKTLDSVLRARGLRNANVSVQVVPNPNARNDKVSVTMELSHNRSADLIAALRNS